MKKTAILASVGCMAALLLAACDDPKPSSTSSNTGTDTSSSNPTIDGVLASGIYNFQGADVQTKADLLAKMEGYAMDHHLAGIPLYDDSGYTLFTPRITLASEDYIPNYGFGVGESSLNPTGNMANGRPIASSTLYPNYFQSSALQDTGTFNYWDSQGEDVSGKNGMITASYFGVTMNDTKDGFVWRGELASVDRPIMLDENGNEVAYTAGATSRFWRVPVYTVDDEAATGRKFRYSISDNASASVKEFDNRGIKLEDYITPFKAMLDNAMVRASGLITDSSGFAGASDYLYANPNSRNWDDVGIQLNEEKQSIDFEFVSPQTQFYAMYNLGSGLYSPIPQEYLDTIKTNTTVGAKRFGVYGGSSEPTKNVDNLLSAGPYVVDSWELGKSCVYSRNENYHRASDIKFEGYVETVYKNEEMVWQDFVAGKLDDVVLPSNHVEEGTTGQYAELAHPTDGTTTLKINVNSCTEEEWEYYFGVNGTMNKHAASNYWDVKPIMSNDKFLDGVFFSIDRATLASTMGRKPALGYLSEAYKIDPETDLSYRDTDQAKAVLDEYASVDPNGHDQEIAIGLFQSALEEEIAKGNYESGDVISLKFLWRYQETIDKIGTQLKGYIETTFNQAAQSYGIQLEIDNQVAGPNYTDCYSKMDVGEYDFAEGAISGNVLNPIEFMSVICTNSRSQGFTTNWGEITNKVSAVNPITYGTDDASGKPLLWSYDALYTAANGAAIVRQGVDIKPIDSGSGLVSGNNSIISFTVPAITDENGDDLISYETSYVWLMFSSGGALSEYYYDLSSTFAGKKPDVFGTSLEYAIPTSTLQGYVDAMEQQISKEIDGVVVYAGVNCSYSGVSKTVQAVNNMPLDTLGLN